MASDGAGPEPSCESAAGCGCCRVRALWADGETRREKTSAAFFLASLSTAPPPSVNAKATASPASDRRITAIWLSRLQPVAHGDRPHGVISCGQPYNCVLGRDLSSARVTENGCCRAGF